MADWYNLREQPFGVTPDYRFLFQSATHREALGSLVYGLASGCGFVGLIARPGMGKTMLLFDVLSRIRKQSKVVSLFQTMGAPMDCMKAILVDLGVRDTSGTLYDLQSRLNEVLAVESRSGKRLVIVFDEAQNLDHSVLEFVRMLSNFETPQEKLIQVVLTGQPELAVKLASPELLQLRQRISILASLRPFSAEETGLYIDYRLRIAGYLQNESLFTAEALELIAHCSQGIPRNINNLCFNALSLGCALKRKQIGANIIREVILDLDLTPLCQGNWEPHHGDKVGLEQIGEEIACEAVQDPDLKLREQTGSVPPLVSEEARPDDRDVLRESARDRDLARQVQVASELCFGGQAGEEIDAGVMGTAAEDSGREPLLQSQLEPNRRYEERLLDIPLFASIVTPPSGRWNRLAKVSLASAVLLGLGVYQLRERGTSAQEMSAHATSVMPATITRPQAPSSSNPTLQLSPVVSTVQVTPGKSLLRICTATFGACSPELMRAIHKLNPRLSNPDHIESGQTIRLPAGGTMVGGTEITLEPAGMDTPEKRGVQ